MIGFTSSTEKTGTAKDINRLPFSLKIPLAGDFIVLYVSETGTKLLQDGIGHNKLNRLFVSGSFTRSVGDPFGFTFPPVTWINKNKRIESHSFNCSCTGSNVFCNFWLNKYKMDFHFRMDTIPYKKSKKSLNFLFSFQSKLNNSLRLAI